MVGITNEEEKQKVEMQRSHLLSVLEERKKSLTMLTEELKLMMVRNLYILYYSSKNVCLSQQFSIIQFSSNTFQEKITVATKELENSKKINSELEEKLSSFEFYISSSQKTLKYSISRKQVIGLFSFLFIKMKDF